MLTSTQSFNLFIEKSYKNDWEGDNDIKTFIKTLQLLEQGKIIGTGKIEKAYANPIKYDYDHCLWEYARILSENIKLKKESFIPTRIFDLTNLDNKPNWLFFDQDKIIKMPGIDYNKIKIYRKYKKRSSKSPTNRMNNDSKGWNMIQNYQKEEFKKQKQRYKSIWNLKKLQSISNFSDFISPSNDYLKRSGNKLDNYGSRNNSPGEGFGTKMSLNSSYGVFKFNISMEEDKLKSIRNNAKSKGLFRFDPSNNIRLSKVSSKLQLRPSDKNASINSKRSSKVRSPNVSHQEIEDSTSKSSKAKRFNLKSRSFLSHYPTKSIKFSSNSPTNSNLKNDKIKLKELSSINTWKTSHAKDAILLNEVKGIKTTNNSPLANNKKVLSEVNQSNDFKVSWALPKAIDIYMKDGGRSPIINPQFF